MSPEPQLYETSDVESVHAAPDDEPAHPDIERAPLAGPLLFQDFFIDSGKNTESRGDRIARIKRELAELEGESVDHLRTQLDAIEARESATQKAVRDLIDSLSVEIPAITPAETKQTEKRRIAAIEARMARIEERLGDATGAQVRSLARKISVLDVDAIAVPENASTGFHEKVHQLYERLPEMERALRLVPHLLRRLQTLQGVHADAAHGVHVIAELDKEMAEMRAEMSRWDRALTAMDAALE